MKKQPSPRLAGVTCVQVDEHWLTVAGVSLRYQVRRALLPQDSNAETGGKEPIVFFHGGGANATWWHPVVANLSPDRDAIMVELSGHGASDWRQTYSFDLWVQEAIAAIQHATSKSCIVIGHSLGGAVGFAAADHLQDHVNHVVSLDSLPSGPPPNTRRSRATRRRAHTNAVSRTKQEVISHFTRSKATWPREVAEYVAQRSVRCDGHTWRLQRDPQVQTVAINPGVWESWKTRALTQPRVTPRLQFSIVLADQSPYYSYFYQHVGGLPSTHVKILTVADVGHELIVEQPDKIAYLLTHVIR